MQESIMQSKKAEQRLRDAKYLHVGRQYKEKGVC